MTNDLGVLVRNANPVPTIDHLSSDEFDAALAAIETNLAEHAKQKRVSLFFQRLRRQPAFVFAVALAVVVLTVAMPLLLFATREGEVAELTVTTTVAPTTTAASATTAAPTATTAAPTATTAVEIVVPLAPEITWTRLPDQPAFEGAAVGALSPLVHGGPGLVGVGFHYESPSGAIFVSSDGVAWERVDLPWDEMGSLAEVLTVGVGQDGTLVAAGTDGNDAAVFVSGDGYAWHRVSSDALVGPDLQNILRVVPGGPGFIAVGQDGSNAGVWVSPDGSDWTKIEDDSLLAGDEQVVTMYDVIVGGPGFVAVGNAGISGGAVPEGSATSAVWVSQNGFRWERVSAEALAGVDDPWGMQSVTSDPATGTIVAFAGDVWTSPDGLRWEALPAEGPPPGAEVAWNGQSAAVAAGYDRWFSLWASGDGGETWATVEPVGPTFDDFSDQAVSVAWFGDRWVLAGHGANGGVIWIGTPEE